MPSKYDGWFTFEEELYPDDPNYKEFGQLLPGNIVNPQGSQRGQQGIGAGLTYSPGHNNRDGSFMNTGSVSYSFIGGSLPPELQSTYAKYGMDYGSHSLGRGQAGGQGLTGVTGGLFDMANPYDPRINCPSRCWCPGGGLGLPCCSLQDTFTGGHFTPIDCPIKGATCEKFY